MKRCSRTILLTGWLFTFVALAVAGCGSGNGLDLAPVTGTVTYGGKPLDHGAVIFTPTDETTGPLGEGAIERNGSFKIRTAGRDGAIIGQHIVTVVCRRELTPQEARSLVVGEFIIPAKYARVDKTPLRFTVLPEGGDMPISLED